MNGIGQGQSELPPQLESIQFSLGRLVTLTYNEPLDGFTAFDGFTLYENGEERPIESALCIDGETHFYLDADQLVSAITHVSYSGNQVVSASTGKAALPFMMHPVS